MLMTGYYQGQGPNYPAGSIWPMNISLTVSCNGSVVGSASRTVSIANTSLPYHSTSDVFSSCGNAAVGSSAPAMGRMIVDLTSTGGAYQWQVSIIPNEVSGAPAAINPGIDANFSLNVTQTNPVNGAYGMVGPVWEVRPSSRFAYIGDSTKGVITTYALDDGTGALSSVGSPVIGGMNANCNPRYLAMHPSGNFLYAVSDSYRKVSLFSLDPTTGAPTYQSSYDTGNNPSSITIDPTGRFLYISNSTDSSISMFSINVASGALTSLSGSPLNSVYGATSIAISPLGYLYVSGGNSEVWVYAIPASGASAGILSFAGSLLNNGLAASIFAKLDPQGRYLYVTGMSSSGGGSAGLISMSSINIGTGLIPSSYSGGYGYQGTLSTGLLPLSMDVDPTGRFAFDSNGMSNTVSEYVLGMAGVLSSNSVSSSVSTSARPNLVVVEPSGKFAYVLIGASGSTVGIYSIDPVNGVLGVIGTLSTSGINETSMVFKP